MIIGLTRVRNESLILQDFLDHMSQFVDGIIGFDDASEDDTRLILHNHPRVIDVIHNDVWGNPYYVQASQRQRLIVAAQVFKPTWLFYADADERFDGDIRSFLKTAKDVDGIRISLFDAYMTPDDNEPYQKGWPLFNFRKWFGPEKRDILMIWKNNPAVHISGGGGRAPFVPGNIITKFYCQHYGKSLSVDHWEKTCRLYMANDYPESFKKKWTERQGKAIHTVSDFHRPLYPWGEELFRNAVDITYGESYGTKEK